MLRMNHTYNDLEYFFPRTGYEFQTLENMIKKILDTIDVYKKKVES